MLPRRTEPSCERDYVWHSIGTDRSYSECIVWVNNVHKSLATRRDLQEQDGQCGLAVKMA